MRSQRPLRLALIGTGRAGLIHGANIVRRIERAELVGLCDASPANLSAAAKELGVATCHADYSSVCADPNVDAVVIVTPTFLHCEIACAAAAAGKHVFLEKPMALSVAECAAIESACRDVGVKLRIGFMRRFDEGFAKAKAVLESGDLGRVMIIKSTGRGPARNVRFILTSRMACGRSRCSRPRNSRLPMAGEWRLAPSLLHEPEPSRCRGKTRHVGEGSAKNR